MGLALSSAVRTHDDDEGMKAGVKKVRRYRHSRLLRLTVCLIAGIDGILNVVLCQFHDLLRSLFQTSACAADLIDPIAHTFSNIASQFLSGFGCKK
jgi:hypothetical protein